MRNVYINIKRAKVRKIETLRVLYALVIDYVWIK